MKIAVFGGTGGIGQKIIYQAVQAGHDVIALVRDPIRSGLLADQVAIVIGDVLVPEKVRETMIGVDAVAVSLGSRRDSPKNTVSEGTRNIIIAMKDLNIRRLVIVTSLGVADSKNQVPLAFKLVMKTVMRDIMADKERQEHFVRDSGLEWIIVRPGELSNDPASGEYRYGTETSIMAGKISRADVADFVIKSLSDDQFLGQAVAVT